MLAKASNNISGVPSTSWTDNVEFGFAGRFAGPTTSGPFGEMNTPAAVPMLHLAACNNVSGATMLDTIHSAHLITATDHRHAKRTHAAIRTCPHAL